MSDSELIRPKPPKRFQFSLGTALLVTLFISAMLAIHLACQPAAIVFWDAVLCLALFMRELDKVKAAPTPLGSRGYGSTIVFYKLMIGIAVFAALIAGIITMSNHLYGPQTP